MKKLILTPIIALLFASSSVLTAQNWPEEYLGLPGDNLNLYAVMNLFQESETLEGFERSLNDPESMINNLDLNRDGYVDYIQVFDYVEGDIHNIVLRVALNEYEYQDVAVFTVQKFRNGSVQVQLIGDEALYGPNYIIEPAYAETPNPGYRGTVAKPRNTTVIRTTYYEVATWPVILHIYRPSYRVWRSTWHWGYYPTWWRPWTPHYWHFYYGYHYNWHAHYYAYYRPWRYPRCRHYRTHYYTNIRNYSTTVVVNINKGTYKNTYSRPDKRKEGEVLYTQRHSRGSTVGNRSSSAINNANRQSARATSSSSAADRSSEGRRQAAAVSRNADSGSAARQATPARTQRVTTGSNSANRSTSVDRNSRQRNETSATPARNVNRQSTDRTRKQAIQNKTSRSRETSARPPRNERNYSSGSSSSRTQRATPPASNRSNTKSTSVQRSERSGSSRQPASNVRSGSSSRKGSSTSVNRSSGSSSRSGASSQTSRSSQRSESSRSSGRR